MQFKSEDLKDVSYRIIKNPIFSVNEVSTGKIVCKMRYDGGCPLLQVVPSGIPPFSRMFLQPDQFSQGHGGEKEEADGLSYSGIRGERLRITLKETLSSLRINPADEIW